MEPQDTITIAPSVLLTTARLAALEVNGVARMGTLPSQASHLLRGHPMGGGIVLDIEGNVVNIDIYVIVKPGVNMREVSVKIQQAIKRAIVDLIGMEASAVNVHIEDVDYTPSPLPESD